nr:hypothetical protein [Tanacetum cinerariifolium]
MNPQETQQVVAHDEKWIPSTERVKISSTNVRLETTTQQKEETFQVVIDVIKNSTILSNVPQILNWSNSSQEVQRKRFTREDTVDTPMVVVDMSKESDFEPARKRTASRRVVKKKVTISAGDNIIPDPNVTLKLEQEVVDSIQALKESKKTSKRQLGTRGLNEGTRVSPEVPDESIIAPATSRCYKSEYSKEYQGNDQKVEWIDFDEDEEKKDDIDDDKSINLEMTDDEETDDENDDEENNDAAKTDAGKTKEVKDDAKKVLLRTPQMLRLTVYWILNSNLKFLISNLIQKFFVKPAPESSKIQKPTIDLEQESEKSALEIHKIKKEEAKKQKMPKYTIKSTYKETLKEYDQKSTLYQTMHENKSFNKNPANHALYHALMKALIEDENAMDKGVADIVKNHKRKHNDDDDDEDLSVRPNQGKKTKRRRMKESKSSKKPSTTKETPKGKAPSKGSKTSKYASTKEPVEEPIAEVVMDDAFNTVGEDVFMIMINHKTL